MLVLHPPVEAPIVRVFEYSGSPYAAGLHRGIDFGAPAGAPVTAPCTGGVRYAGQSPGGGAVTLRCAGLRVTVLPLTGVRVRTGERIESGAPLGRLDRSGAHDGVHLGVRDAADRLAYLDPAPLLAGDHAAPPGPMPPPSTRRRSARPRPAHTLDPGAALAPELAPAAAPGSPPATFGPAPAPHHPEERHRGPSSASAPWPAWVGASIALLAAFRTRTRARGRRAHAQHARRSPSPAGLAAFPKPRR